MRRLLEAARARWHLRAFSSVGAGARIHGSPIILNHGRLDAGDDLLVHAAPRPVMLITHAASSWLRLGHGARIGSGTAIQCTLRIEIGDRCRLGEGVLVFDSDFHRRAGFGSIDGTPIRVGDDCDIGDGAVLLRGTSLGDRVRVMPGSVVQSVVRSGAVIGGNPARVIEPTT